MSVLQHMQKHKPDLVLFHNKCNDGMMSAVVHYRSYRDMGQTLPIEIYKAGYSNETFAQAMERLQIDLPPEPVIHVMDLSYLDIHEYFDGKPYTAIVLDHHESVIDKMTDEGGFTKDEFQILKYFNGVVEENVTTHIFMNSLSAAGMVWNLFHSHSSMPEIVKLVQDRDLWHFEHADATSMFFAISAHIEYDLQTWLNTIPETYAIDDLDDDLVAIGCRELSEEHVRNYTFIAENRPKREVLDQGVFNLRVLMVKAPTIGHSEVGNIICKSDLANDPVIMFFPLRDGKITISIRSYDGSNRSAAFVGTYLANYCERVTGEMPKGGGHTHAYGITLPADLLPHWVQAIAASLDYKDYKKRN